MADSSEVEDGKIEIFGPEVDDVKEGGVLPLGIEVLVYGRKMQEDFEPVMERQIHYFLNYPSGIFHMGQRNISWVRFSKDAVKSGFKIRHIGTVLHAKMHLQFANIMDKVQIKIYTNPEAAPHNPVLQFPFSLLFLQYHSSLQIEQSTLERIFLLPRQ